MTDQNEIALPPGLLDEGEGRRLHLGGVHVRPGWEILNAQQAEYVDHVGDIRDLSRFEDKTFSLVYASHVFEHLGYQEDLGKAIDEVARVLNDGGRFMVSVPDLMILARIFGHSKTPEEIRFHAMRMMFGGQIDPYDFHYVGLWDHYFVALLQRAGFREVYRVPSFGLFQDASEAQLGGMRISLSLVAVR